MHSGQGCAGEVFSSFCGKFEESRKAGMEGDGGILLALYIKIHVCISLLQNIQLQTMPDWKALHGMDFFKNPHY